LKAKRNKVISEVVKEEKRKRKKGQGKRLEEG